MAGVLQLQMNQVGYRAHPHALAEEGAEVALGIAYVVVYFLQRDMALQVLAHEVNSRFHHVQPEAAARNRVRAR